jgi:hypothetical protein
MAATGVMTCRRVISNAERASNISAAPFMDVPTNEFGQDRPVSLYGSIKTNG